MKTYLKPIIRISIKFSALIFCTLFVSCVSGNEAEVKKNSSLAPVAENASGYVTSISVEELGSESGSDSKVIVTEIFRKVKNYAMIQRITKVREKVKKRAKVIQMAIVYLIRKTIVRLSQMLTRPIRIRTLSVMPAIHHGTESLQMLTGR